MPSVFRSRNVDYVINGIALFLERPLLKILRSSHKYAPQESSHLRSFLHSPLLPVVMSHQCGICLSVQNPIPPHPPLKKKHSKYFHQHQVPGHNFQRNSVWTLIHLLVCCFNLPKLIMPLLNNYERMNKTKCLVYNVIWDPHNTSPLTLNKTYI